MNKLTKALVPVVASTALILVVAGNASAAVSVPTDVTFTITGGELAITAPATATLTGATSSTSAQDVGGALGAVTVSDLRGTTAGWNARVISTAFTPDNAAPAVPATAVDYTTPDAAVTGLATVVAASRTGIVGVAPVQTATATGSNTATWNPTLTVHVPVGAQAGVYSAVVTHTVV